MDQSLETFFRKYERAFATLDLNKTATLYSDHFISAGPRGVIAQSKAEFLKMADKAAEFYKSVGQKDARILSMEESPISDAYTMVKVHWGVQFEKTGDRWIEFDVSYIVHLPEGEPEIILFVAHQDEEAAMKELGLSAQP